MDDSQEGFVERCDYCGAKAFVRVDLLEGELFFCGHHFEKHREALEKRSFGIDDRTVDLALK